MPLVKQPKAKQPRQAKNLPAPDKKMTKRHKAFHELWAASANLPAPPIKFEPDTIYRIKLTKAVTATDHSFPFKPSQDVQVTGRIAEEIRQYICGAIALG